MASQPLKKISLFFSNGIGLWNWKKKGLLSREITLYQRLHKKGWQLLFFTYDRSKKLPLLPAEIEVISQWPFIIPKRFNFLYELILPLIRFQRGQCSSLIITNQAYRGWPAILAGKLWRCKVVARCGMVFGERTEGYKKKDLRTKLLKYLEEYTFKKADICIVPTYHLAAWISTNYAINKSKIQIVPNFVDSNLFRPKGKRKSKIDILIVGRLENIKRHFLVLQAARGTKWRLRFIGSGVLEEELRLYAKQHKIDLEILPKVPNNELPIYYNDTKIFALLSKREGHPKALLEAMSCGCACVGTDSQGINNILNNGHTGCIVKSNSSSIRETFDILLNNDEMREELGRNARDYISKTVDLDSITQAYEKIFEVLLESG